MMLLIGACAQQQLSDPKPHPGILWAQSAAEYEALSRQAYNAATVALDSAISDTSWSALPGQANAHALPVAIILDIDQTLVSNAEFEASMIPPFASHKLDDWNNANKAVPMPGAANFARAARDMGVTLFFITNRSCRAKNDVDDSCPQEGTAIQDLHEVGIPADSEHVMLAFERPEWNKEKVTRRNQVSQTHRVIMLVGDDLGDFISCTRAKAVDPCDTDVTIASRAAAVEQHQDYWGSRWFVLPNPMYGSWTTVR
jgi:acid phosphatase